MEAQPAATPELSQDIPATAKPKENKSDKFIRLAEPRVVRVLHAVRKVGNLSVRGSYEYEPDDVAAICTTIRHAVDEMESRFRAHARQQIDFKLRG